MDDTSVTESVPDISAKELPEPRCQKHSRVPWLNSGSNNDMELSDHETDSSSELPLSDGSGMDIGDDAELEAGSSGPSTSADGDAQQLAKVFSDVPTTTLWCLKCSRNQEMNPGVELDCTEDTLCAESNCEDSASMESMVVCNGPGCKLRVSLSFDIIECYRQEVEVSAFLQGTSSRSRGRLVLWWHL